MSSLYSCKQQLQLRLLQLKREKPCLRAGWQMDPGTLLLLTYGLLLERSTRNLVVSST